MTPSSLQTLRKPLASALAAALIVTAPGPLAVEAAAAQLAAIRATAGAPMIRVSPVSAAGAMSSPSAAALSAPGALAASPLSAAAASADAAPAAAAAAQSEGAAAATVEKLSETVASGDSQKLAEQSAAAMDGAAPKYSPEITADMEKFWAKTVETLGTDRRGRFNGMGAVWKEIARLGKSEGVNFVVVTEHRKDMYQLAHPGAIVKGRASQIDRDGFRPRELNEDIPHKAVMAFVGAEEPVELYIDRIGGYKVAKIVKSDKPYSGELAPYDALLAAQRSHPDAKRAPTPAEIKAATPRYDVMPLQKAKMYLQAGAWWLTERALYGVRKAGHALGVKKLQNAYWDNLNKHLIGKYLYYNMAFLRLQIWDANKAGVTLEAPENAYNLLYRSGDGTNFDITRPTKGRSVESMFTQIKTPEGAPAPLDEKAMANARASVEFEKRPIDPKTGKPIIKEAKGILNVHASSWIQFMVHDWMNHRRRALSDNPILVPLAESDPLAKIGFTHMRLDRTKEGKTVNGVPVFQNELTPGWDLSMIYGATNEIQSLVRTFEGGMIKVDEANKKLLEDPSNPGLPITGMADNMSGPLEFLHTLFHLEHNAIARALKAEHPDWNDEQLFQMTRLRLSALVAKLHTVEWTRALLPQDGLQIGMWLDWTGFLGKSFKEKYQRFLYRHPTLGKLARKLVGYELLIGMPGSRTIDYGSDYAMPEEFVNVYRLHTMIRDSYSLYGLKRDAKGNVSIEVELEFPFEDMTGPAKDGGYKNKVFRDQVPMQKQAVSFGHQPSGTLDPQNMPEALMRLHTQDGRRINMAAVNTLRTRERSAASTYVKFVMQLGEIPPKTFLELTGGNQEYANLLERYFGTVENVPFRAGIQAERKPRDFALGDRQFKVFVLMAPRRLKSDKFLSQMYMAKYYGGMSGLYYVENTTFSDLLMRHFPGQEVRDYYEGIPNAFAPVPTPGTLMERTVEQTKKGSEEAIKKAARLLTLGGVFSLGAVLASIPLGPGAAVLGAVGMLGVVAGGIGNMIADRSRRSALEGMNGSIAHVRAGTKSGVLRQVLSAERSGRRSALLATASTALTVGGAALALIPLSILAPAWATGGAVLTTLLMARGARQSAQTIKRDLHNNRVAIEQRLNEGKPKIDPATIPGETAIQKKYWFLAGDEGDKVATFGNTFKTLRAHGLPAMKAFMTAALSHLPLVGFSRKTQKNMTEEEKQFWKPGFFDIYVPNMIDAQGAASSRIYAPRDVAAAKGMKAGDVDMDEFEWISRQLGLRLYFTAKDFARMRSEHRYRAAQEGRGNPLSRLIGSVASKRRHDQLIELFSDMVVWEEDQFGRMVPAISKQRLLEIYRGSAHYELMRDRAQAKADPIIPPMPW